MTAASGTREVSFPHRQVWRALTSATPYCPVCDVSYVFADAGEPDPPPLGLGTRFVCAPGRLEGAAPPRDAPRGEVVTWDPERRIGTRLETAAETWDTDIRIDDAEQESTRVTVTITREPKGGNRLVHRFQQQAMRRLVQRMVESELAKLPAHVRPPRREDTGPSVALEQGTEGLVLHLRGDVDATAVQRLGLERCLQGQPVTAIDVRELIYLDATGLHPLVRWARDAARAGRPAVVRGENPRLDVLLQEMGLAALFHRGG